MLEANQWNQKKMFRFFLFFKAMKEKALYMLASQATPTYGVESRSFSELIRHLVFSWGCAESVWSLGIQSLSMWLFDMFSIFTPNLGKIFTQFDLRIFFRWVETQPPSSYPTEVLIQHQWSLRFGWVDQLSAGTLAFAFFFWVMDWPGFFDREKNDGEIQDMDQPKRGHG